LNYKAIGFVVQKYNVFGKWTNNKRLNLFPAFGMRMNFIVTFIVIAIYEVV